MPVQIGARVQRWLLGVLEEEHGSVARYVAHVKFALVEHFRRACSYVSVLHCGAFLSAQQFPESSKVCDIVAVYCIVCASA